jgi:hypothetical protein
MPEGIGALKWTVLLHCFNLGRWSEIGMQFIYLFLFFCIWQSFTYHSILQSVGILGRLPESRR